MVFLCRCSVGVLLFAHYVAFLDPPASWFEIVNSQSHPVQKKRTNSKRNFTEKIMPESKIQGKEVSLDGV